MMVKWANDGLPQANDGKMLINDGEMSVWYTHFSIIDEHSPSLAWCKPSFAHLTIIEKLHRLYMVPAVHIKVDELSDEIYAKYFLIYSFIDVDSTTTRSWVSLSYLTALFIVRQYQSIRTMCYVLKRSDSILNTFFCIVKEDWGWGVREVS